MYEPREWVEKQLSMTDEEKKERERYFTELLRQHGDAKRLEEAKVTSE